MSEVKLTWDDLIIQNIERVSAGDWLAEWRQVISGPVAPIIMSKFGDWFLRRPDGIIVELSVIEGAVQVVAKSDEEFKSLVNSQGWQELHLLSGLVYDLHSHGLIPGPGQCYGFAPHPVFAGSIDLKTAVVMDISVWQSICAQTFVTRGENWGSVRDL